MIIAEVHPDEAMKLAAQVAAATVLLQIQPRRIRMDSKLKPTFPEEITHLAATFKQETGNFELRENDRLLDVQVGIDIRLFTSSKEIKDQAIPPVPFPRMCESPDWPHSQRSMRAWRAGPTSDIKPII